MAALTLLASATRTTSGAGASVDLGSATSAQIDLTLTAASASPTTLVVAVQTSADGTLWETLATLLPGSTPGRSPVRVAGALRYLRASYTISGAAPSFTFGVSGTSVVVYATPADFDALAPSAASSEDFTTEEKDRALESATSEANGYLNARYTLPLTAWGHDLRQHTVSIAAYRLLVRRGWSPVAPEDDTVRTGYTDALAWLAKVKDERISPPDIIDSTPDVYDAGGFVVSRPKRGW